MTEQDILRSIRLALNGYGRYFRNNVGQAVLPDRVVRYGLCKGSSDLIGWTVVGDVALFTAIEVKRPGKKPTEVQHNFINRVNESGGIGFYATSADEAVEKLEEMIKIRTI